MPADMSFDGGLTISMQCTDRRKSAAWYADALGFRVLYDAAEIGWCELSTHIKGVNIGLSQREAVTPGGPVPTWGVKDIASARAQLEGKGVRFDGDHDHPRHGQPRHLL